MPESKAKEWLSDPNVTDDMFIDLLFHSSQKREDFIEQLIEQNKRQQDTINILISDLEFLTKLKDK
tara:strand:+ start:782 stop:979 length:198 start_codon:yes stop_codon:yes gene_type:complete